MTTASIIPTHAVAAFMIRFVDRLLDAIGLRGHETIQEVVYTILVFVVAIFLGWIIRKGILFLIRKAMALRHSTICSELLEARTPSRCSHIIPALLFMALIPFAFDTEPATQSIIMRCAVVYFLITLAIALCAILSFIWVHYDSHENTNNHPLKGVFNIAQGIVWCLIVIVAVSVLIDKSPLVLLGGLGAFAAALMLIFKDSILGFVAGIQLSSNDMLRVGDWIVVPSTPANGTVMDVSLTVVKVRNWDNTVVMLPPYTLVSTSFQNWRGMSEAGARQIQRSVYIDNSTIRPADAALLQSVAAKYPVMAGYITGQKSTAAQGDSASNRYNTDGKALNGTIDTNLGLFRAYICEYLLTHPRIDKGSDLIVRLMQPQAYGTPLQLYCFTNITEWVVYEAIQSEIFEHLSAAAPDFGLTIYNVPDRLDVAVATATPAGPDAAITDATDATGAVPLK